MHISFLKVGFPPSRPEDHHIFLLPKHTFRQFSREMMITEKLKYKIQMLEMLIPCFTIYEDIIKEDLNKVSQVGPTYFIHQYLECGRNICEAKWHDQKFIVAIMCAESCFRDIILMNSNLVIPRTKIQLGEKMSTMKLIKKLIKKLINNRNWKLMLDCD